jgi:hypothetical protein
MATELKPADREGSISSKEKVSPSPSYNAGGMSGVKHEPDVQAKDIGLENSASEEEVNSYNSRWNLLGMKKKHWHALIYTVFGLHMTG